MGLLEILKTKAKQGLEVSLILKDPNNLKFKNQQKKEAYLDLLNELSIAGIKIFFCWYMHMKVIIIDNIAVVGSANLTLTGMKGLGEIAVILEDRRYVDSLVRAHMQIRKRQHEICMLCDKKKDKICGYFSL